MKKAAWARTAFSCNSKNGQVHEKSRVDSDCILLQFQNGQVNEKRPMLMQQQHGQEGVDCVLRTHKKQDKNTAKSIQT